MVRLERRENLIKRDKKRGIFMYKILQLTNNEANALDEIIRVYKLPLEVCVGDP